MSPELSIFLPAGIVLGGVTGFVLHRSGFCMAGAFRDLFLFRRTLFLKCLVLYWGAAALLFEAARLLSLLPFYPFPLPGTPSWGNLAGGVLFGFAMVLAGGCVVGVLVRTGEGSLPAMCAVAGMVAGSALYAEIHPAWARLARAWALLPPGVVTLPQLLGTSPSALVLPFGAGALALAARWHRAGGLGQANASRSYLQPRTAVLVLVLVSAASWIAVGMPLGITTTYSKAAALLTGAVAPEHAASLAYYGAVPLDLPDPRGTYRFLGGPGPGWDTISAIQLPLIAGIVGGAALSACLLGELRLRTGAPARQYAAAAAGGVLLGLASRMAPACNVWHLLGGVPILSATSILFLLGLFPGAWAGGRLMTRLVFERDGP